MTSIHVSLRNVSLHDDDQQPESSQPDSSPVKVVLAYDGNAAFHAAKKVYHGIMGRLAGQFGFRVVVQFES